MTEKDTSQVERLIEILQKELGVQQELLGLADRKRQSLVRLQVSKLEEITHQEEQVLARLGALIEGRIQLIMDLGHHMQIQPQGHMMEQIAGYIGGNLSDQLLSLTKKLRYTIHQVNSINRHNKDLIEQSLRHIREFLGFIVGESEADIIYGRNGTRARSRILPRLMIDRVA
jgi:flagellar biosynthesis/type III secretory pathway chaperone